MKWCKKENSFCSWFYSFNFALRVLQLEGFLYTTKEVMENDENDP
nr:MAG TPA: hypothetical protein [Caudoviricetes sp.]